MICDVNSVNVYILYDLTCDLISNSSPNPLKLYSDMENMQPHENLNTVESRFNEQLISRLRERKKIIVLGMVYNVFE